MTWSTRLEHWKTFELLFCNGNPKGTSIIVLDIANQDVGGIIMTGSADGVVHLYLNYDLTLEQGPLQLISRDGAVTDARTETQGLNLEINFNSPATSISSDVGSSQTLLAGFADGVLKVFNKRLEENNVIVRTYADHTSRVQNIGWHPALWAVHQYYRHLFPWF